MNSICLPSLVVYIPRITDELATRIPPTPSTYHKTDIPFLLSRLWESACVPVIRLQASGTGQRKRREEDIDSWEIDSGRMHVHRIRGDDG